MLSANILLKQKSATTKSITLENPPLALTRLRRRAPRSARADGSPSSLAPRCAARRRSPACRCPDFWVCPKAGESSRRRRRRLLCSQLPDWRAAVAAVPGNGKRDDKVLHRQQLIGLLGEPLLSLFDLAVGAVSITAGPSHPMFGLTTLAAVDQIPQPTRSTANQQPQHFTVMRRHPVLVLGQVVRNKPSQGVSHGRVGWSARCIGNRGPRLAGDTVGVVTAG